MWQLKGSLGNVRRLVYNYVFCWYSTVLLWLQPSWCLDGTSRLAPSTALVLSLQCSLCSNPHSSPWSCLILPSTLLKTCYLYALVLLPVSSLRFLSQPNTVWFLLGSIVSLLTLNLSKETSNSLSSGVRHPLLFHLPPASILALTWEDKWLFP